MKWRFSFLVATARCWRTGRTPARARCALTGGGVEGQGRPPLLPRRSRSSPGPRARNRRLDRAAAQCAGARRRCTPCRPAPARAWSRPAPPAPRDLRRPIAGRRPASHAGARHRSRRPSGRPRVRQQVNLAGQTAAGPAQRLPVLLIRCRPSRAPGRAARPAPAAPGDISGGSRRAPAACWRARTTVASTATARPGPPPRRTRRPASPGSSPRSRPRTSGAARRI